MDAALDGWTGPPLTVWWRDDDAVADTPALRRLLALRSQLELPLALAVIPSGAEPGLADVLPKQGVDVLAHGWDHRNHARPGHPMAELAFGRDPAEVVAQLTAGRERLMQLFGPLFRPVLVPPFNQLSLHLTGCLAASGFTHVSIDRDFGPHGLLSVNVHADIMDWTTGTAADPRSIIRGLLAAIRLRRLHLVDPAEPIGIMTHHLAHDEAAWEIVEALLLRFAVNAAVTVRPISDMIET